MALINILDDDTINKIAAGEVIERPASVVKELCENSIDAGASALSIEIRGGGIDFIRITDNGSGILAEDVRNAFLRHATSKIKNSDDLLSVLSLGFRGEALASIAAIARCELITRTANSMSAVRYIIEGGKECSYEEIGAPVGTTFIIRDLFFNTPARRKFLKGAAAEAALISSAVEKLALSHPEVSIHFINSGKTALHTVGSGKELDVIYEIFGRETAKSLVEVSACEGDFVISGFTGKPLLSRGSRSCEIFDVNGRFIKSEVLSRALEDAYHGFVMQHKYPFAVIHLNIPSAYLDVNVHPAKLEVRFSNEQAVYDFVYNAVYEALTHKELIARADISQVATGYEEAPKAEMVSETLEYATEPEAQKQTDIEIETKPEPVIAREEKAPEPFETKRILEQQSLQSKEEPVQEKLFDEKVLSDTARESFKLLGILFDTYFLVEYKGNFLMIDQHAAHEKVLYERTMNSLAKQEMTSQLCNPPIIISVSKQELELVSRYGDEFTRLGFDFEPFGGKELAVRGVPANLYSIAAADLLTYMLGELESDLSRRGNKIIEERIASLSCKAAVKGNQKLSLSEAEALIDELLSLENPYTCPHGRPTAVIMTKYEIEKLFKRIV